MTIEELIERVRRYEPSADAEWLRRVYELAVAAHQGQRRASGESYVEHPLAVAGILAELEVDHQTIAAALLHDVVEDTSITSEQVTEQFGEEVARLVDGVTKLTRIPYQSKEDAQVENLRKMFLAMAKDIRVIIIKLADRLHNMRTLASLPEAKQQAIARETLDIYAPIAHRLGIWKIKWEIEDECLRYLDPESFATSSSASRRRGASARRTSTSDRAAARRVQRSEDQRGDSRTSEAFLLDLFQDQQGPRLFDDLRSHRDPHHRRYGQGLLRARSAPSTRCGRPYRAGSKITSRCRSQTCISRCTRRSSDRAASRSKFRSAPGRCTARASTASRRTGATKKAARPTSSRTNSPGCARCSNGRKTCAIRACSWRTSSSISSTRRSSSFRRAATSISITGRRHAARLRLSGAHRRRQPLRRRQG